ncbi:MAG TPA: hypothetical protein VG943_06195 [Caulobacterales bacterium]|nr:hypothetical protein [Caulobacterales bacterium]
MSKGVSPQNQALGPRAAKPRAAARPPAFSLADKLGQAAWAEADQALARALADFANLERAADAATKALKRHRSSAKAEALDGGALMLRQSLLQLARKRGLTAFGEPGAVEAYDPRRHELNKPVRAPAFVKVLSAGWARGVGANCEVLVKARVVSARQRGVAP